MSYRRALAVAIAALAALVLAPSALAQTYDLESADVRADVLPNGTLSVAEDIRVAFSGSFTYGYRDIPVRQGERVQVLGVREADSVYLPGAPTQLEPGGPEGRFGVERSDDRVRIVWRFNAVNETRTFTVRYRMTGLAVAYDDVVDVNLQVWGDQWEQRLGRLTAAMAGPGDVTRAWGHPVWVHGDVRLAGRRAFLRALDVPPHQYVELRALYPRDAFSSTSGMRVVRGNGLEKIAGQERDDAASFERDQERIDELKQHWLRTALILLAIAVLPALAAIGAVWLAFGRERATRLRPRVRAGAADRHRARSCAGAPPSGGRVRLVRMDRDALRPDPTWLLQGPAGHDRAIDLGWPAHAADRRSRGVER